MLRIARAFVWSLRSSPGGACVTCRYPSHGVHTWTPLAAAFNAKPEKKPFISLTRKHVGLFGISELTDYTGFSLLQESVQNKTAELVKEVTSAERSRNLVEVFDDLSDCLCRLADMADFVRVAHPEHVFREAAEDACVNISGLVEQLNTNVDIFAALKKVVEHGDILPMDDVDQRVAELFLFDFEQSGIHLQQKDREKFVALNEKILMLGNYFMQGTHRPMAVQKDQLPEHLKYAFALDGDNVMVTGLFNDHHNEKIREAAYKIYLYPHAHQMALLEQLLEARNELAKHVGFSTYAHRSLRGTMGGSPEAVSEFLHTLAEKVRSRADLDFEDLRNIKLSHGGNNVVFRPWDVAYYSGMARNTRCQIDQGDLAPYLSLGNCMEGLSALFDGLYGVTLEYVDPDPGELWSHDVHKVAVVDSSSGTLGHIYCDFFERPGKPHQDCHFTIRGGRQLQDGSYQDPAVVLMLNLPVSLGHFPSLLTPGMVENLFHEFGHAMHSMLGRTRYQHVTGTRCPTDFAEVPSVLMEYFWSDYRVLSKFARHWETGDPIPKEKADSLFRAKNMYAASDMQLQVFYSLLDQKYHSQHPLEGSTTDVLRSLMNTHHSLPYEEGTALQLRFGHFVGYGAKYYSYLMSRAVASKIWQKCFKEDPFSRTMGTRYRETMLAHGGGKHPADLVEAMLQEKPTTNMMVDALMNELDESESSLRLNKS